MTPVAEGRRIFVTEAELERLASKDRNTPLYMRLSQLLQNHIANGNYPVGGLLPTEAEFATAFGVSRQTVRQAIGQLRNAGLVSARKGVGTRVEARKPQATYQYSLQSLTEIFQYASETVFYITQQQDVAARGKLANDLGCRPGRIYRYLAGVRRVPEDDAPLCVSEVWVDGQYAAILQEETSFNTAIFALIEQGTGEMIQEVVQSVHAVAITQDQAEILGVPAGSPALKMVRRYFGTGRRLVEMSQSIYPGDRFDYYIELKRV